MNEKRTFTVFIYVSIITLSLWILSITFKEAEVMVLAVLSNLTQILLFLKMIRQHQDDKKTSDER